MPEPTPEETLLETISDLREAAQDTVMDAARLWRQAEGWSADVLRSAVDVLVKSEEMLGQAYDNAPPSAEESQTSPVRTPRALGAVRRPRNARPAAGQARSRSRS